MNASKKTSHIGACTYDVRLCFCSACFCGKCTGGTSKCNSDTEHFGNQANLIKDQRSNGIQNLLQNPFN